MPLRKSKNVKKSANNDNEVIEYSKIYLEYIDCMKYYMKEYGDNTIVFMQIGNFYEIYSNMNDCVDMDKLYDVSYLHIALKDEKKNIFMMGMPIHAIDKYVKMFTDKLYTVVVYVQVDTDTKAKKRELYEIYSPGIKMLSDVNTANNNLVVIYLEEFKGLLSVGIFIINTSTGDCMCDESISIESDKERAFDEICRILTIYNPLETVIVSEHNDLKCIESITEMFKSFICHNRMGKFKNEYKKSSYQQEILNKCFQHDTIVDVITHLGLEYKHIARNAITYGLQFVYEHSVNLIKKLNYIYDEYDNKKLCIETTSAVQLNIVNDKNCLLNILNRCITKFGMRMFKERLLNPITYRDELEERYSIIERIKEMDYIEIVNILKNIVDIPTVYRRAVCKKMLRHEWVRFDISLKACRDLLKMFEYDCDHIDGIIYDYEKVLDINECNNKDSKNCFKSGIYEDIDELNNNFNNIYEKLMDIVDKVSNIGDNQKTQMKIDNDKNGTYLGMTKKRFDDAMKIDKKYMKEFNTKTVSGNNIKVYNDETDKLCVEYDSAMSKLESLVDIKYKEFLTDYTDNIDIYNIVDIVGDIDIGVCNARNMVDWNLTIPEIIEDNKDNSCFDIKGIRHPIIERMGKNYIKNDISLGIDNNNGMLLYGINSSGKSSLMKAVGLNIVMAQSGMAVFCDKMKYKPYKSIFTRISGMDNIYKGMSSFIVEMTELRNILLRSDKNTLVIGDEVCSGTESTSGTAIVASTLDRLCEKDSTFLFATHLHDLVKFDLNNKILIRHMSIDIKDDNIYYNRILEEGEGDTVYGLDVCKYLKMPSEFLINAEKYRKIINDENLELMSLKRSNYNKDLYMDMCQICKKSMSSDTHHIIYQRDDMSKMKNLKDNLIQLCIECHKKEHGNKIKIHGYVDTIQGKKISYEQYVVS